MIRLMVLSLVLSVAGPQPEAFAQRVVDRINLDRAYEACMARGGDDDWECELILERGEANNSRRA